MQLGLKRIVDKLDTYKNVYTIQYIYKKYFMYDWDPEKG